MSLYCQALVLTFVISCVNACNENSKPHDMAPATNRFGKMFQGSTSSDSTEAETGDWMKHGKDGKAAKESPEPEPTSEIKAPSPSPSPLPSASPSSSPSPSGTPEASGTKQQAFCAGGAVDKGSKGARASYLLDSVDAARQCAAKIAAGGKYSDSRKCKRYASYGLCDTNGLKVPWGVSLENPLGTEGPPQCECFYGVKGLVTQKFPTWRLAVKWNEKISPEIFKP